MKDQPETPEQSPSFAQAAFAKLHREYPNLNAKTLLATDAKKTIWPLSRERSRPSITP